MTNPILSRAKALLEKAEPIATHYARNAKAIGIKAGRKWDKFPAHSKVGLTLGSTSLALGLSNNANNRANAKANKERLALETKSLTALNSIHKSLEEKKP